MAKGKKKILLLIPNLTFGGAQRVFADQAQLLAQDHDVIECVYNLELGQAFITGNPLVNLNIKAGVSLFGKFFRFLERVREVRRIKKKYGIDITISHLEGADLVNVLSKRKDKVICWVHGSKRYDKNIAGLLGVLRHKILIPFTYRNSDIVVTVSNAIAKELRTHYAVPARTILTIHNFFNVWRIRKLASESIPEQYRNIFNDQRILVTSGRLARQKNHSQLLRWYAQFPGRAATRLVIVGDGELRQELFELCERMGLSTYHDGSQINSHVKFDVYFLGFQQNPFPFLKASTLFLLPSSWEGFPMVLGEAMACGAPIASADCPTGPREFLTDFDLGGGPVKQSVETKFGLLLPMLSDDAFHIWNDAIGRVLNNNDRLSAFAAASSERILKFSEQNYAQELNAILA